MTDPLLSELCNESNDKIMDFDDTELLTSNNNFDFHSFKETRENNNGDFNGTYEEKIERLNTEKMVMQSRLNNKVIELQTQIVKLKNTLEKSEMSKAEIEVEVTKVNKEMRNSQRQHNLKVSELEKTKFELTNHFKTLETDYLNQISQLNSMHRLFQEQVSEEKRNNQKNQESLCFQINQLSDNIREKDNELSKSKSTHILLNDAIMEHQSTITDLTKKIKEFEENILRNRSVISEQDGQLESLKTMENKLKGIIVELNAKINQLESKNFEEKHELNDSRNYQSNLQSQLLDLQQAQIMHEKERQLLSDKVHCCNRRIKELEESLNNQIRIAANYREQIKKLENEKEMQEISINEATEDLQSKVEELESKLQIQTRVIDEVNDEISSSRENEILAVSHLTKTLEEVENYITEASGNFKVPNTSPRCNKIQLQVPGSHCQSPPRTARLDVSGDSLKQTCDIEYRPVSKNIMKNLRHTILNFRERINTLESDRQEAFDKVQTQDKEIKNLKSQLRRFAAQQKTLESENSEKQREIENLLGEISQSKSVSNAIRQESSKNVSNLKQTLHRTTDEYQDNIEIRDNYLHTIAIMIKDALNNGISSIIDKNTMVENVSDARRILKPEQYATSFNDTQNNIESSTQTQFIDKILNKDNLQLSGNLTGTFRFLNENCLEDTEIPDTPFEKRPRGHPNTSDKKLDHQVNNNIDDKKKSSLKRVIKKPESKTDTNGAYVDSSKSWPALREVISSELVSLLNRYDIQRAQCQQLMSELSAKENIITRLLSNQNSNSAQPHARANSISRCQQTSIHEPTLVNKSPNKISTFSQNNIVVRNSGDIKKKSRGVLKSKLENVSSNVSNKKCFKPENQKQPQLIPRPLKNPLVHTSKKATITSTKLPPNPTGNHLNLSSSTDVPSSDVNTFSAQKPTAILPLSTQQVILRCPEIVDDGHLPFDECNTDSRLFPILIGTLLRLIHTNSRLQSMCDLIYFYKLCYHRSIDCSKLISINNDLEKVIHRSNNRVSLVEVKKPNCRRFKSVVHVMTVCQYLSRKLLATKLFVPVESCEINSADFAEFFKDILESNSKDNFQSTTIDNAIEKFTQFCVFNNCQDILIEDMRRHHKANSIMTSSSTVVFKNLKKNVDHLKSICANQVTIVQYKSKKKSYQMNLKALMTKITELIHIINGQNSVIEMREEEIVQLKEHLSTECNERIKLVNLINEINSRHQSNSMEMDYNKLIVKKTKSYLTNVINLCQLFLKDKLFDFTELMKKEESIYRSFELTDCDDLIDCVRDGIRVALNLSGSMKSIII